MSIKRILVIAWFYPPVNSSEGVVTYKLLEHSEHDYDVFTQKKNNAAGYVQTELKCGDNIRKIYCEKEGRQAFRAAAVEYYASHIGEYDIVMTRSMPEFDHSVGLDIKKINPNVTWIASFGDPIAENPYYIIDNLRIRKHPGRGIKSTHLYKSLRWKYYASRRLNKFQKEILDIADIVICNNTYEVKYLMETSASRKLEKFVVLPHSFDEALYPALSEAVTNANKPKIFSFVGHLDRLRTPRRLLEAVKRLRDDDPNLAGKVRFEFYGDMEDGDIRFISENCIDDVVEIKGSIDYLTSLKIMKKSDWLMHFDADISSVSPENIFFAAKLADYIGTGNQILGITSRNGAACDIITGYGGIVCEDIPSDIYNYLYKIIYEESSNNINECFRQNFNAVSVGKDFDELISQEKEKG